MPDRARTIVNRSDAESHRRPVSVPGRSVDGVIRARSATSPRSRGNFLRETASQPQPVVIGGTVQQSPISDLRTGPRSVSLPVNERQQKSAVLQRQFVQPQRLEMKTEARRVRRPSVQFFLVSMAVVVFLFGIAVSLQTVQTNKETNKQVMALANGANDEEEPADVPSSKKPSVDDYKNYKVAPDLARYIKIPTLGVDARVLQVGLTQKNAIDVPNNIHDTAWYSGSAKPGNPGATVIDGHVSGWNVSGVFGRIKNLSPGDTIEIVKGDGKVVTYKVVTTKTYDADKVDMKAVMQPIDSTAPGLNLITCDGRVQSNTHEFDKRVVVFARLQN